MAVDFRLEREVNPPIGESPGFLPQHKKQGTLQYEETEGTDGALHTKIEGLKTGKHAALTVATTVVEITAGLTGRRRLKFRVAGSDAVYIGFAADVTVLTGFPYAPGQADEFFFSSKSTQKLYAIAKSSQTLRIIETN
ncbi:hypothetical protein [Neobacillus sp. NPDC093127]|uniref:hypothetical protein n=1 Tax=Neobacillus sp. NPDC093127 TaxID=3364296 RepID=UPI00382D0F15